MGGDDVALQRHMRTWARAGVFSTLAKIPSGSLLAVSCAYSIVPGYSSPLIRVRSSAGGEQDIYAISDALDTTSLLSFVGANTGYVVTGYDQSGNARDLTQPDTAKQPIIVDAGSLVTTAAGVPTMTLTSSRALSRTDALGLTGAPALTMATRFATLSTNYPLMARVGDSDMNASQAGFAIIPDPGTANMLAYISIFIHGPDFHLVNASASHYYVARAAAGAANSTFTMRQDAANCSVNSIAGNGALPMALTNEFTSLGGVGFAGPSDTGNANVLCIYNENMTGTRLSELESVLALHL